MQEGPWCHLVYQAKLLGACEERMSGNINHWAMRIIKQVVLVAATSIRYAVLSENKLTEGLSICWNQKQVLQMGLT